MQDLVEKDEAWRKVLGSIELELSKANFTTWFKGTSLVKVDEGMVYVGVPNAFVKDWLINKYHKIILKYLRDLSHEVRGIEYTIIKDTTPQKTAEKAVPKNSFSTELPLADLYINKDDNLNPRYTFENFVIGPFNELAYAAAQAVIKKMASYNPLFFYGSTGRGKTHLIQAIGNHIKKDVPSIKIFYISSDRFSHEYTSAVQEGKINIFKEKYRKYDVFIMDDIQFLSKKEKTQEELFHLFNYLHENNKQIIFSSDQHPNYIPDLEERLKSRFVSGMIIDIPAPDFESRAAIIKNKARSRNFNLPEATIEFLAGAVEGNIRELEGILNTLICQTELKGRELDVAEVKNLIKDSAKPQKTVSIKDVVKVISKYYDLEENILIDKTRKKEVVKPRQIAMYILREDYNISFPSIGQKLGGRDHTTVIHSCEKIKDELKNNPGLIRELTEIRSML